MEKDFVSKQIKHLSKSLSMSRQELSSHLGTPYQTLYNYEIGRSTPNAAFLTALMDKGISAEWFLTGEGDMFRPGTVEAVKAVAVYDAEGLRSAGYKSEVVIGDVETGVGVGLLTHESESKWVVQLWTVGVLADQFMIDDPVELVDCLNRLVAIGGAGFAGPQ